MSTMQVIAAVQRVAELRARYVFSPAARVWWVKTVLAVALVSGCCLSPRLWTSQRAYPLSPVTSLLPRLSVTAERIWLAVLVTLLVGMVALPRPRWTVLAFVGLAAAYSLFDQTRWQPWFYQYLCMLTAIGLYAGRQPLTDGDLGLQSALNACRFILAGTYFWSGVQKFNLTFVSEVYPWLIEPLCPESARQLLRYGGLCVPIFETLIGLALLLPAYRTLAMTAVMLMHGAILFALGPWGHNWNMIVWPWNGAMILCAFVLFASTPEVSLRAIVWPGARVYRWVVLVLFGVLPALSFVERWDAYLSSALYSGNTQKASLDVTEVVYQKLPAEMKRHCGYASGNRYRLDVFNWSIEELNAPAYPARRVSDAIARSVLETFGEQPDDVILVIQGSPHWLSGIRHEIRYDVLTGAALRRTAE